MNTVGKRGRLGEHIRCVVSVSMLTEGWDANTVTHILGIRAFGTQLLCEQVVGRACAARQLRRRTRTGMFEPEYAEVYGVPFSFLPTAGTRPRQGRQSRSARSARCPSGPTSDRVPAAHRLPLRDADRAARRRRSTRRLDPGRSRPRTCPTRTELDPIVGERRSTTLDDFEDRAHRRQSCSRIAKRTLDNYFRDDDGARAALALPAARSDHPDAGSTNASLRT